MLNDLTNGDVVVMKIKRTFINLLLMAFLASCASNQPVFNVKGSPMIGVDNPSLKFVEASVLDAGQRANWDMRIESVGHIIATTKVDDKQATVRITFDTKTYNIEYIDSKNLDFDGINISNYYVFIGK